MKIEKDDTGKKIFSYITADGTGRKVKWTGEGNLELIDFGEKGLDEVYKNIRVCSSQKEIFPLHEDFQGGQP